MIVKAHNAVEGKGRFHGMQAGQKAEKAEGDAEGSACRSLFGVRRSEFGVREC